MILLLLLFLLLLLNRLFIDGSACPFCKSNNFHGKLSKRGNFAQVGNNANSLTPLLDSIRFPSWQGSARRNPHLINRVRAYYAVTWFARGWRFEGGGDTKLCFHTYLYSQRGGEQGAWTNRSVASTPDLHCKLSLALSMERVVACLCWR